MSLFTVYIRAFQVFYILFYFILKLCLIHYIIMLGYRMSMNIIIYAFRAAPPIHITLSIGANLIGVRLFMA